MSPFASALTRLLDESTIFDRKEWAYLCGTNVEVVNSWLDDSTCPRPHALHMIVTVYEQSSDMPKHLLEEFKAVCLRRATEVSPFGKRMLPTIWEYIHRPVFSDLSNKLARLSPGEQEKLLVSMYPDQEMSATQRT